jgi:hypothetical protein
MKNRGGGFDAEYFSSLWAAVLTGQRLRMQLCTKKEKDSITQKADLGFHKVNLI